MKSYTTTLWCLIQWFCLEIWLCSVPFWMKIQKRSNMNTYSTRNKIQCQNSRLAPNVRMENECFIKPVYTQKILVASPCVLGDFQRNTMSSIDCQSTTKRCSYALWLLTSHYFQRLLWQFWYCKMFSVKNDGRLLWNISGASWKFMWGDSWSCCSKKKKKDSISTVQKSQTTHWTVSCSDY